MEQGYTCKLKMDELEPHYDELDAFVDKIVNSGTVSPSQAKYFEACRFKVKALWYISQKIESLDRQYREHISISSGDAEFSELRFNKIDALSRVLRENHLDETTRQLLDYIDESKRLHGVIIDPNKGGKKSIRDLIAHRERIDIFFIIRKDDAGEISSISEGALLNMRHREFVRFPNYSVRDVSSKVWFLVLGIVQNFLKVLAQSIEQKKF